VLAVNKRQPWEAVIEASLKFNICLANSLCVSVSDQNPTDTH